MSNKVFKAKVRFFFEQTS